MKTRKHYFSDMEKYKFQRTLELSLIDHPEKDIYRDQFFKFIKEYDKRRDLNFSKTFPEIANVWKINE